MSKHVPNKKQISSFNRVIKAIELAKKSGLIFYGKQGDLIAYTKTADSYAYDKCPLHLMGDLESNGEIPYLSGSVLSDSGADDYAFYISEEDRIKYNPDNF